MDKEIKQEFDNLGRMIKVGFDEVDKRLEQTATKKDLLDLKDITESGFRNTRSRLDTIEKDLSEIRKHFVYRDEFEDLMGRVKYLESKLGIESGK